MTIADNITFAPVHHGFMTKDEANKKAAELLDRVGLSDKAASYPSQLSGGQKQRAVIAISLAMNPDIMLYEGLCDFTVDYYGIYLALL